MIRTLAVVGGLAALACPPVVFGDVMPFSYWGDERNITVSYWVRLFEGEGTEGPLVFELSGSTHNAEGTISGVVVHDGDDISQIQIESWTGATTSPLYVDDYVEGLHVELEVPYIGVWFKPSSYFDVSPEGDFSGYMRDTITPGSQVLLTVGDFVTYDIDLGIGLYGTHPVVGNVTMVGGSPRLTVTEIDANIYYLGSYGYDYTFEGRLDLSVDVPEPATGLLVLPGLMALCCRRLGTRRNHWRREGLRPQASPRASK